MNTIYTYYEKVDEAQHKASESMLAHWSRSWASRGWNPVVLSQKNAQSHPLFNVFNDRVKTLPTINPVAYELACYHRWLAVAQMGGGFMSDYDVINYDYAAHPVTCPLRIHEVHADLSEVTPSLVSGTQAGFERACTAFCSINHENLNYKIDGVMHASDMILLQMMVHSGLYTFTRDVKQYGEDGWKEASLVHYSSRTTANTDRVQCVKYARSL